MNVTIIAVIAFSAGVILSEPVKDFIKKLLD
jgi:hypothetical protein